MANPRRIILCWACEEQRATANMGGHPLCDDCMEHFTAPAPRRQEYPTADVAQDIRFGGDSI